MAAAYSADDSITQPNSEFMAWLRQQPGVRLSSKIHLTDSKTQGSGRSVVTLESTTEDEELLVIPENLALSFSNSNIKLDGDVNEKEKALGPWFSLMLSMIYEYLQNGASRWHQYLQILPISFNTLMFWTDVELKELQGSSIVGKIGKRDADETITNQILPIVIEHPDLFPPPMGISSFDHPDGKAKILELAHRMGSLIMAYAFDVERPEDEEEADEDGFIADDEDEPTGKAMVPLADMLKPDADNNARLSHEDGYFIMKTTKPVGPGEELSQDCGEIPRAEFLRRYGYITDNHSKYDVVEIPLETVCKAAGIEPDEEEPHLDFLDELEVLDDGYTLPGFSGSSSLENIIPDDLLAVLHVVTLSKNELRQLRGLKKRIKPSLSHTETKLLIQTIMLRQADYSTTVDQDNNILSHLENRGYPGNRLETAIHVRMGEKEILSHYLARAETYLGSLGNNRTLKRVSQGSSQKIDKRRKP